MRVDAAKSASEGREGSAVGYWPQRLGDMVIYFGPSHRPNYVQGNSNGSIAEVARPKGEVTVADRTALRGHVLVDGNNLLVQQDCPLYIIEHGPALDLRSAAPQHTFKLDEVWRVRHSGGKLGCQRSTMREESMVQDNNKSGMLVG